MWKTNLCLPKGKGKRHLYESQEATVRTRYGTTDWLFHGERSTPGCLLSPCLLNLYAEHIMRNARLDELQLRMKIGGRNTNSLRNADDTTLMSETEEELKNLLMMVMEESERASLRLNIKKKLRSWHLAPLLHGK